MPVHRLGLNKSGGESKLEFDEAWPKVNQAREGS